MVLGVAAVITTSVIGIAVAFLLVRYDFPGRNLFSYLTMLPMILPPLVGVLGFVFILGRAGTVNVLLMDWFGLEHPINFMYGMHGVLLVETRAPVSADDAVHPRRARQGRPVARGGGGGRGRERLAPLPRHHAAADHAGLRLRARCWSSSGPSPTSSRRWCVGVQDLLAPQAYLNIVQFVDRRIFRMGIVISALLVVLAIVFVLAARQYVAIKDYSSLSYSRVERRRLGPVKRWLAVGFLVAADVRLVHPAGRRAARRGRPRLGADAVPGRTTRSDFFRAVSIETPKFIINSLPLLRARGADLCLVIGVPMAWIMARTKAPGRRSMDALTTLILAIPGTAIGIAYIRAFNFPLPCIDIPLTGMWIILPLVLAVRRLPYTVRGSYSSLLLVHQSMEEAAENVGATKLRTFRDITVPLVWKGILVGALFSFITSIQEASATIFLTLGGWEMIPFGIFTFYIAGSQSQAAALGVILIVVAR